jgi:hypothetical protein
VRDCSSTFAFGRQADDRISKLLGKFITSGLSVPGFAGGEVRLVVVGEQGDGTKDRPRFWGHALSVRALADALVGVFGAAGGVGGAAAHGDFDPAAGDFTVHVNAADRSETGDLADKYQSVETLTGDGHGARTLERVVSKWG